jgi:hypothetical protein
MTTTDDNSHPIKPAPGAREALTEALRRKGIKPFESADDWASDGIFESDDELNDFLEFTYTARRANITGPQTP